MIVERARNNAARATWHLSSRNFRSEPSISKTGVDSIVVASIAYE